MKRSRTGTSLIEAMIAMAVLLAGLLGFASIQIVGARSNTFARHMSQATQLALDLKENIKGWDYSDTRLAAWSTVTHLDDSAIVSGWDLGSSSVTSYTAQFSDNAKDPVANAESRGALGTISQGMSSGSEVQDAAESYTRYWNVFEANLDGLPHANGKFVQIIVRWKEPGFGYRQVTASAFKPNPAFGLE